MRLELVLGPKNTILRSRTNVFGEKRRTFPPKSNKCAPKKQVPGIADQRPKPQIARISELRRSWASCWVFQNIKLGLQ